MTEAHSHQQPLHPPEVPEHTLWQDEIGAEFELISIDKWFEKRYIYDVFPQGNDCFMKSYKAVLATGEVQNQLEFWERETVAVERVGWWLRGIITHSQKGPVKAGSIIRTVDFAQRLLKSETGIGVARWTFRTALNGIMDENAPATKSWFLIMGLAGKMRCVCLDFWLNEEMAGGVIKGQQWTITARRVQVEWESGLHFRW
jgi:hypothetical protein